jgi:acetylornithine/N-succinyldiaminopimelate aminotransferase
MQPETLRSYFQTYNAQTTQQPLGLVFEKAEGCYLYSPEGKAYLDLISGVNVSYLGHNKAEIIQAGIAQMQQYMHLMVYGEYVQSPQVEYAKALCEYLPKTLNNVYFTNSGAEATEGAMKLAKRVTGRKKIMACHHSYHGSTQGALSVMGNPYYKEGYGPLLPDIHFIRYGSLEDIQQINSDFACIILEAVQGEAGIVPPPDGYLKALKHHCKEHGVLLILDEIQTGFGRTGSLWYFEQAGMIPDILLLGKALGAGMPLGAFIAERSVMQHFTENPILGHITTGGGHPVSCACGLAGFKCLVQNKLYSEVEAKGAMFESLLVHPSIQALRRKGLLIAIEFESFELNKAIIDTCIEHGILTDWFLHNAQSMRIAPPLTISRVEIEQACKIILEAIEHHA